MSEEGPVTIPENGAIDFVCGCHNAETCPAPPVRIVVPTAMFLAENRAARREHRLNTIRALADIYDNRIDQMRGMLHEIDPDTERPGLDRDFIIMLDAVQVPMIVPGSLDDAPPADEEEDVTP